jgi:hypothetical protein
MSIFTLWQLSQIGFTDHTIVILLESRQPQQPALSYGESELAHCCIHPYPALREVISRR